MIPFKKTTEPQLDIEIAGKILEQAFLENQMEPNTIPLDVLISYSRYRKERFTLQRTILVIVMVLFILLPFFFIAPSFTLYPEPNAAVFNPVYRLDVDTFMPVDRVSALTHYINVENVDLETPSVVSSSTDRDHIYLYLSDSGSGVDYEQIKAVDADGQEILPVSYDESAGCVVFDCPKEALNVYVSDKAENTLHLILTIR